MSTSSEGANDPPVDNIVGAPRGRGRGMPDAALSFSTSLVLGLISAVVISRLYGVESIGEFALVSAPYVLVTQFSNVGEQVALVRILSNESPASARSASMFTVVLGFSTALTVLAALIAAPIATVLLRGPADQPDLVAPALVLLATYVAFGNVSWNCDMVQSAFRGTRALLVTRFFDLLLLLALSVVLALVREPDTEALVLATVITLGCTLLLRLYYLRQVLTGRPTRPALRAALRELPSLLRFGVKIVPGVLAQAVTAQAGLWIISAVRAVDVLGAYSRANNLANRLGEAGFRLGEVLLPFLSHAVLKGDYEGACWRFSRWRLLVLLGLLVVVAPLAGAAEGALSVFGPGFSQAWVVLGLLLLAYGASVINSMHIQFLLALGLPSLVSQLMLARAGATLALTAPLTIWYGAAGAALAILVGFLVELAMTLVLTERRLAEHGAGNAALPWFTIIGAGAAGWGLARAVDLALPGFPGAVAAGVCGLAACAAIVMLRGVVSPDDLRGLTRTLRSRA